MYWSKLLAERAELDWRKATEKSRRNEGRERENAKMASGAPGRLREHPALTIDNNNTRDINSKAGGPWAGLR